MNFEFLIACRQPARFSFRLSTSFAQTRLIVEENWETYDSKDFCNLMQLSRVTWKRFCVSRSKELRFKFQLNFHPGIRARLDVPHTKHSTELNPSHNFCSCRDEIFNRIVLGWWKLCDSLRHAMKKSLYNKFIASESITELSTVGTLPCSLIIDAKRDWLMHRSAKLEIHSRNLPLSSVNPH